MVTTTSIELMHTWVMSMMIEVATTCVMSMIAVDMTDR